MSGRSRLISCSVPLQSHWVWTLGITAVLFCNVCIRLYRKILHSTLANRIVSFTLYWDASYCTTLSLFIKCYRIVSSYVFWHFDVLLCITKCHVALRYIALCLYACSWPDKRSFHGSLIVSRSRNTELQLLQLGLSAFPPFSRVFRFPEISWEQPLFLMSVVHRRRREELFDNSGTNTESKQTPKKQTHKK